MHLSRCDNCGEFRVLELVTVARGQFLHCRQCIEGQSHDDRAESQPDFLAIYYGHDVTPSADF